MTEIVIRKASLSDAADLTRLSEVLGYPISDELLLTNLSNLLKEKEKLFFVAEVQGAVHGFIQGEKYQPIYSERMINVLGLVVDRKFQGLGIGGQLLNYLEQVAREQNFSEIRLNSSVSRHLAHQFYQKQGYVLSHEQKKFHKLLK